MNCAWQELLRILPQRIRDEVDKQGRNNLQELRLRIGKPILLITKEATRKLNTNTTKEDIHFVINTATRYSPWTAGSMANGYITSSGGHRIGICGEAVIQNGVMTGIREPAYLCIRVARDFPGIAAQLRGQAGSGILIGPPGSGKTTLLRDLIRQWSKAEKGSVAVVDQRGEVFPPGTGYDAGDHTDVLTGCDKSSGIENVLKTMSPKVIAVDEITSREDANAILNAHNCGVFLLATAHGATVRDLFSRAVYRPLVENDVFCWAAVLRQDQTYYTERISTCS